MVTVETPQASAAAALPVLRVPRRRLRPHQRPQRAHEQMSMSSVAATSVQQHNSQWAGRESKERT